MRICCYISNNFETKGYLAINEEYLIFQQKLNHTDALVHAELLEQKDDSTFSKKVLRNLLKVKEKISMLLLFCYICTYLLSL